MTIHLLRKSFDNGIYLPQNVLWRTKEAFSDGVSSIKKPWYEIINNSISKKFNDNEDLNLTINNPVTNEQKYYRMLFNKCYHIFILYPIYDMCNNYVNHTK